MQTKVNNLNKNISKILAILFLLMAILCSLISYIIIRQKFLNPVNITKAKVGDYAEIQVEFLTESMGQDYFSVYDGDKFYIAHLNDFSKAKVKDILDYISSEEEMQEPEAVIIKGNVKIIPLDIKKLAIKQYNDIAKKEVINEDNFFNYFGLYILDTYKSPISDIISYIIIDLFFLLMSIVCLVVRKIKFKGGK